MTTLLHRFSHWRCAGPVAAALCTLLPASAFSFAAAADDANVDTSAVRVMAQDDGDQATVDDAIEALRRGDFGEARRIVDALFVDDRERSARTLLGEGRPMESMAAIDQALELDSVDRDRRARLLVLRGRAAFAAAASDVSLASLYEEALGNFEEAARNGAGVAAALRASRAARMVGDGVRALELARASVAWIDGAEGRAKGLEIDQSFARTWSEAAFGEYLGRRQSGDESDEAVAERDALFEETQRAIERSIGEDPTDTWGYGQLANLFLWEGRGADALRALETALAIRPDDEGTHTAFARLLGDQAQAAAEAAGGDAAAATEARHDAVIASYAAFREAHPENAYGYWYGGFEAFDRALWKFESAGSPAEFDPSGFVAAEELFRGCRERAPAFVDVCTDYEILCRTGAGWALYRTENDDGAVNAFFSTEELRAQDSESASRGRAAGLDMALGGRLPSALAGVDFVIRRCMSDPTDVDGLDRATVLADRMFAARPANANLANNAGFVNRDAAVLWDNDATRRFRNAENDEERAAAQASRDRAQTLIEASWAAYQVAARLLPDDVRVVNDAGLVMAYYIRTDPEAAEVYFLDAVKDGAVQLADESMPEDERDALEEAWGDAHQNLGIIEMTIRHDPAKARQWFIKSLEIGPASRNWLKTDVLPLLDSWIETGKRPEALAGVEARTVWVHNP